MNMGCGVTKHAVREVEDPAPERAMAAVVPGDVVAPSPGGVGGSHWAEGGDGRERRAANVPWQQTSPSPGKEPASDTRVLRGFGDASSDVTGLLTDSEDMLKRVSSVTGTDFKESTCAEASALSCDQA